MRLLHSADWHLGRQFHNVSLIDDQAHLIDQFVKLANDQKVDAVVIAGDIYDRSVPPAMAVELLDEFIAILCSDMQIPVILIPGNHDSAERLRFGSRQMRSAGLHILGDLNQIDQPVVLNGQRPELCGR